MNYRRTDILAEKSLDASGTETIDLNVSEPISRLELMYRTTKGGHDMTTQISGDVSKIELVDGSEVLHSLSGHINQALCIYNRRVPALNIGQHLISSSDRAYFAIDFGRYLWDPLLAFDPKRYKNPQLKVTYSRTTVDTTATANYLSVVAHLFDEKVISPMGFLMSKEIHSESDPADDSYKYVDLPTDFPIRKIILRAEEDGYAPDSCIEGFKLSEDNDKRVPIDVLTADYHRLMRGYWIPIQEPFIGWTSGAGTTKYVMPTDYLCQIIATSISAVPGGQAGHSGVAQGGKFVLLGTESLTVLGNTFGYLPNHCLEFPFGLQDDPSDWYDVTKVGSLIARVRGGSVGTGGTFQIALEQLRKY